MTEFEFEDEPENEEKPHFNFFPITSTRSSSIGLVLMILLSALATILPATLGPRADPLVTPEIIKPEWFFYVTFPLAEVLFSGTVAVLSMGFIVFVMFVWPFIDGWIVDNGRARRRQRLDRNPRRVRHHRFDRVGRPGGPLTPRS